MLINEGDNNARAPVSQAAFTVLFLAIAYAAPAGIGVHLAVIIFRWAWGLV